MEERLKKQQIDWLARCALRDQQAFKALYDSSSAHLFALALRITRRRDLAEDVLQEAFVQIWNRADSYRAEIALPMTWMGTIVRYRALDRLRRMKSDRLVASVTDEEGEDWELADPAAVAPAQMLDDLQTGSELERCLRELAEGPRHSIALAFTQGLTHQEVAEHLGEALGTVKSWIRRGLERMRLCLQHETA